MAHVFTRAAYRGEECRAWLSSNPDLSFFAGWLHLPGICLADSWFRSDLGRVTPCLCASELLRLLSELQKALGKTVPSAEEASHACRCCYRRRRCSLPPSPAPPPEIPRVLTGVRPPHLCFPVFTLNIYTCKPYGLHKETQITLVTL